MIQWIKILFGLKLNQPESVLRESKSINVYIVKKNGYLYQVHVEAEDLSHLSPYWQSYRYSCRQAVLSMKHNESTCHVEAMSYSDYETVIRRHPNLVKTKA